jgi:hypothetical protein
MLHNITRGTRLYSLAASFDRAILLILVGMYRAIPAIKVSVLKSLSRCIEIGIGGGSSDELHSSHSSLRNSSTLRCNLTSFLL